MIKANRIALSEVQFLGDALELANLCNVLIHSEDVDIFKYVTSDDGRNQVHVWLKKDYQKWDMKSTTLWSKKTIGIVSLTMKL